MRNDTSKPPELEYERPSGITRRAFRLLLLLTFINTILLGASLMGPQHWQAVRNAYNGWKDRRAQAVAQAQRELAQQAARVFQFPEKHVAYTEVPEEALKLISQGRQYRPIQSNIRNVAPPPGWQAPVVAQPLVAPVQGETALHYDGLLFLHERRSPDGTAALVQVVVSARYEFNSVQQSISNSTGFVTTFSLDKERKLYASAFTPGVKGDLVPTGKLRLELILPDMESAKVASVNHPDYQKFSATQPIPVQRGNQLRLFGGSPDPADPSHFTIPYELDGQPGTIDGWLKDDALVLQPRQGRAVASAGDPTWALLPTTNPATGPAMSP